MIKKRVYLAEKGHRLDRKLLEEQCQLVDDPLEAEVVVAWKRPPDVPIPPRKVIICQSEPPIVDGIRLTYSNAARWHTFVTYIPTTPNAIPFSETAPHLFPFWPWIEKRVRRPGSDLHVRGNGIYFAGHRSNRADAVVCGVPIIYQRRAEWAEALADALGGLCVGNGWPVSTKDAPHGWHESKFEELDAGDYDFHFCAENSLLPGYFSEKFWHGLLGDRLTVYMGHPRIKELVDPAAYVFAADYNSPEELAEYLAGMPDDLYRAKIYAARSYLDSIESRPWRAEMSDLTARIIERIYTV